MTRRLAGRLPPGTPPGRRVTARPKVNPRHAAASGPAARERAPPWLRYHLKREILINGSQRETRVAILEDDRLVELLVDRPDHRRTVGDIYLGRVEAVLPGIQAAFVDIGQEKSAFLHASDLLEPDEDEEPEEEDPVAEEEPTESGEVADPPAAEATPDRKA